MRIGLSLDKRGEGGWEEDTCDFDELDFILWFKISGPLLLPSEHAFVEVGKSWNRIVGLSVEGSNGIEWDRMEGSRGSWPWRVPLGTDGRYLEFTRADINQYCLSVLCMCMSNQASIVHYSISVGGRLRRHAGVGRGF